MNWERRGDQLLLLVISLLVAAFCCNRSLPTASLAILDELSQGNFLSGPNFGYKLLLAALHQTLGWTGASLITIAAAGNAIAGALAVLLSYEFFRLEGLTRERARFAALSIALSPAVILGVNVFGAQGMLIAGLSLSFYALARAGRAEWQHGQVLLLLSLVFSFAIDRSSLLLPIGWIAYRLIKNAGDINMRPGLRSTIYCLAAAATIGLIDPQMRSFFFADALRGLGPLAWLACLAVLSAKTRFATALLFASCMLLASTANLTELANLHDGWTLWPLLWPLALLGQNLVSPKFGPLFLLVSLSIGVARVSMYDDTAGVQSLQTGLQSLMQEDDTPLLILGDSEELARARLALPSAETRLIQNIVNFAELAAAREYKGESMETVLLGQINMRAGEGQPVFLSRAAEDRLRDPLFRSQHAMALRVLELLKSSFDWTSVQAGSFQGQQLRLRK